MKTLPRLSLALLTAGLITSLALAQSSYDLTWFKAAPGGPASGGAYTLQSALGQAEAGGLTGGPYSLTGGFIQPAAARYQLLLPVLLRNPSPAAGAGGNP